MRRQLGAWPLAGLSAVTGVRNAITRLCVREPPYRAPSGSPMLAAPGRRVEVVVSELVANALRHGRQPVRVQLASTGDAWLISVTDAAPELEPTVGTLTVDQPGGRGMALVLTMAARAGWYTHDGLKTVWADVPDQAPAQLLDRLKQFGSRN